MEDRIRKILGYKVIAVGGMSKNPEKPSHYVSRYVNYPSLTEGVSSPK